MNIFILDTDPIKAAQMQCDKHAVKMVLESAQMLSTAHRILDGELSKKPSKSGKTMVKSWELPDSRETSLYNAVHIGHPCTVWTMESSENYKWHYEHFKALAEEYQFRFGKVHKSWERLGEPLSLLPNNIPSGSLTKFKLAMGAAPECVNETDPVGSYRSFYKTKQQRFSMTWKKRQVPDWFVA
jgi:hypothetical protein